MTICVYGEGGGVVLFPSCHTLPPEKYVVLDIIEQMRKKKKYIYIYIYGNISEITVTLDKYS